jgi:hypothetical protein
MQFAPCRYSLCEEKGSIIEYSRNFEVLRNIVTLTRKTFPSHHHLFTTPPQTEALCTVKHIWNRLIVPSFVDSDALDHPPSFLIFTEAPISHELTMLQITANYLAAGANRHPSAADWDESGLLAFGADRNIALWRPQVSWPNESRDLVGMPPMLGTLLLNSSTNASIEFKLARRLRNTWWP